MPFPRLYQLWFQPADESSLTHKGLVCQRDCLLGTGTRPGTRGVGSVQMRDDVVALPLGALSPLHEWRWGQLPLASLLPAGRHSLLGLSPNVYPNDCSLFCPAPPAYPIPLVLFLLTHSPAASVIARLGRSREWGSTLCETFSLGLLKLKGRL